MGLEVDPNTGPEEDLRLSHPLIFCLFVTALVLWRHVKDYLGWFPGPSISCSLAKLLFCG